MKGVSIYVTRLPGKPKRFLYVVWPYDEQGDDVLRTIVTKENHKEVGENIAKWFGLPDPLELSDLFRLDVAHEASKIPGIEKMVKHPVTGKDRRLFDTIIDLNDNAGWSREKIADWLDTLDEQPKFGDTSE